MVRSDMRIENWTTSILDVLKPIVSIDEAIIPIKNLFININRYVKLAKKECRNPQNNLTQDESASIYLYTCEFTEGESLYRILNETLRSIEKKNNALKPWFPYFKLYITALSKLPSQTQTVYRGVQNLDINLTDYQTNKEFQWFGVTSCTTTIETLNSSQFFGETGGRRILFSIHCFTGRSVTAHSALKDAEKEVILLPGTWFRVTGHLNTGPRTCMIQLEEIRASPFMNITHSAATKQKKSNVENYLAMIELQPIQATFSKPQVSMTTSSRMKNAQFFKRLKDDFTS
ncbi:unnamed protein product [Rotaria sordida]|uniref:NAD(P)(+)--arginine ADP-ribosyltransferase n=1 Tax=Rotaria sordida TaxID=392033 RepID=A0A820CXD5_9BILA|nr:unnamed protein product [Rotaria sordida]